MMEKDSTDKNAANDKLYEVHALIVDDDDVFYYLFQRFIENINIPMNITRAGHGKEALDIIRKKDQQGNNFDIAFIDLNMPIMGGIELLEEVSQDQNLAEKTNFYVISSSAFPPELEKARAMPIVQGLLGKPLETEKIKTILASYYRTKNSL